jgi:eukaryotic-like serine/threonine-protein kinase
MAAMRIASRQLGRYKLTSYLGSGGMGDVYGALHTGLQKRVALKLLKTSLRADGEAVKRFLREGECAARVRHPNVVDVSDLGTERGVPYLVMELLEGETLAKRLARAGKLQVTAAIDIMLPVLDALAAVHDAGVLHRDVKPANILLAERPGGSMQPKLVDFGVARFSDDPALEERALGTPHYMSPEQARGEPLDARSDQYAVASVLYELLTGITPFTAESPESVLKLVARGEFPSLIDAAPLLPDALDAVITRAGAARPADRYPSMDALSEALLPFASPRTQRLWQARAQRTGLDGLSLMGEDTRHVPTEVQPAPSATSGLFTRSLALSRRALGACALLAVGLVGGLIAAAPSDGYEPASAAALDGAVAEHPTVSVAQAEPPLAPTVRLIPPDALAELDGIALGSGSFARPSRDPADALHALRVSAPGYVSQVVLFRGVLPESTIALERIAR